MDKVKKEEATEIKLKEQKDKSNEIKVTRQFIIQCIFLILLAGAIIGLIVAITTVYKYKDMLANPLGYSLNNYGINQCMCYDNESRVVILESNSYNESKGYFRPEMKQDPELNKLPELNLSGIKTYN